MKLEARKRICLYEIMKEKGNLLYGIEKEKGISLIELNLFV